MWTPSQGYHCLMTLSLGSRPGEMSQSPTSKGPAPLSQEGGLDLGEGRESPEHWQELLGWDAED